MIKEICISTPEQVAFVDITSSIKKIVKESSMTDGVCIVFVPHTTAAITINENADPSVKDDITAALAKIVPENSYYAHMEGNSPAHVKASLLGNSETILIKDGALLLGTWQGVYFCEFDGPRKRRIIIKIVEE